MIHQFALPPAEGDVGGPRAVSVLRDGGTSDEEDSAFKSSSQRAHLASVEPD